MRKKISRRAFALGALGAGALYSSARTAPPTSAPAFVPGDTVSETRTAVSGSVELPPYSETVLRA
ncbi:hypothetical protein OHB26_04480 [Nocardia sp. NBC_01503]|uniref:hypothetical protein n=1 Tax=Nocardia sp. NBC_01503 TaxID=2975997 RepID=UPI002E7AEBFE|nr:hypothetical protein [Nocardia sp. NBC_01503]WTL33504.1 hypothetical protein OHB26_04480 [Nocardia sp. NBC_01503]